MDKLPSPWYYGFCVVELYNTVRLHSAIGYVTPADNSAIGYVTPADKLLGLEPVIHAERDRKLDETRQLRRQKRRAARGHHDPSGKPAGSTNSKPGEPRPLDIAALRRQVSIEEVLKVWKQSHPEAIRIYRAQERRGRADRKQLRRRFRRRPRPPT